MTNVNPRIEFGEMDYGPLNQAIERESEKSKELLKTCRGKRYYGWSRTFFKVSIAISVLILSAAFAWWLLKVPAHDHVVRSYDSESSDRGARSYNGESYVSKDIQDEKDAMSTLKVIGENRNEVLSIDTTFTVFIKTPLESGEAVITGKKYNADALEYPFSQYCYLATIGNPDNLEGIKLVTIIDGDYVLDTNDDELKRLAEQYCQFEGVQH